MQIIMHFRLLLLLSFHYVLQFLLFEFGTAAHFVDFEVEHLVGGFRFAFDDLELLSVVGDFSDDVVHLSGQLLDGASQAVTDSLLFRALIAAWCSL